MQLIFFSMSAGNLQRFLLICRVFFLLISFLPLDIEQGTLHYIGRSLNHKIKNFIATIKMGNLSFLNPRFRYCLL